MTAARIPAAEWQAAKNRQTDADRERLARWLGIDPANTAAWYVLLPFVRMETDDGPRCAAVLPPALPFAFGGPTTVHDDADVLLVDGAGRAAVHRAPGSHLFGTIVDGPLYTDAVAFLRDWARNRLFFVERVKQSKALYHLDLHEECTGSAPGTLAVGDVAAIKAWPIGVNFTVPDKAVADVVNISIWRQARLARAQVAAAHLKAVG